MALIMVSVIAYSAPLASALPSGCASNLPCFYGYVKMSNGSPLSGATVKAYYKSGQPPATVTTNSAGYYAVNLVQSGYFTVAAVKAGYTYAQQPEMYLGNGQQSRKDFAISTRNYASLDVFIVVDEEFVKMWGSGWQNAATSILFGQASYWQLYYSLGFAVRAYYQWNSPNTVTKCMDLQRAVVSGTKWGPGNYRSSDVMLFLTGQALSDYGGCATIPFYGGSHPSMVVNWNSKTVGGPGYGLTLLLMHETGHIYGLQHYQGTYFSEMRYENACCIATFAPSEEQWVNSVSRTWY